MCCGLCVSVCFRFCILLCSVVGVVCCVFLVVCGVFISRYSDVLVMFIVSVLLRKGLWLVWCSGYNIIIVMIVVISLVSIISYLFISDFCVV